MTCKDCIHYEVCGTLTNPCFPDEANKSEILCNNFKNKDDFVEVVRCSECRFNVANMEKDGYDTTDYDGTDIVCSYFMTDGMRPDDFCSYGERK